MTAKIGSLIIDLKSTILSTEERELLAHPLVGGVILFTRNYSNKKQLQTLCKKIRSARRTPLLIMVDQEGGRVQRFIDEFLRLPAMSVFGKIYESDPNIASELAKHCGFLMASELLNHQIDLSLAPVVDLQSNLNPVIGNRAFHANPEIVTTLASAYISGMCAAGMSATIKHFPGHGFVHVDSHHALPRDERTLADLQQTDLLPFINLINNKIDAVLAAHIIFSKIDPLPVGYSRYWLHDILRLKFGFSGIIFSDDLNMEGANISSSYADRVLAAREAGCDFALLCNNPAGVIDVIDKLPNKFYFTENNWQILQGKFTTRNQLEWQKKANQFLLSLNYLSNL